MLRDSRWTAASWLANRMPNGGRVEYFGASQKLPPLATNVTSARSADYRGLFFAHDTSEAMVAEIVASWETNHPDFILVMPDHTSRPGLEYDASVPPGLYRALLSGSLPYHLAATVQDSVLALLGPASCARLPLGQSTDQDLCASPGPGPGNKLIHPRK